MPRFSQRSLQHLSTCSPLLRTIAEEGIKYYDFTVVWGHREEYKQNELFQEGFSQVKWPYSKHNKVPSEAFDIVPWPINWDDRERFFFLAGTILSIAKRRGISLRWGGAWKGRFNVKGEFDDLAHFELY